jgi:hypothetical protein
METTGTGKGSKKRKSANDQAYKKNLEKVEFEEKEDLPFKLTVNGRTY